MHFLEVDATSDLDELEIASHIAKGYPQTGSKREKENTEYEITHRTFRCIRSNRRHRVRSVRRAKACCAVRGAKVLHNHEKPGGRVGRPRRRPRDAGDVKRQAAPRLAARHLEGERARA